HMTDSTRLTPVSSALLAWYFVAVWGSGYVATKVGLQYAPPFTFLTLRFGFGLAFLAAIVLVWKPLWPATRAEWLHLAVAGLLMHAVQLGASHYAQYLGMSAGVTALVISCQPPLEASAPVAHEGRGIAPREDRIDLRCLRERPEPAGRAELRLARGEAIVVKREPAIGE